MKEDNLLENDLRKYVGQNFKRSEILDFVQRDCPELYLEYSNPRPTTSPLRYIL